VAVYKMTTIFQYASAVSTPNGVIHRSGGWSESWYYNAASIQAVIAFFNGTGAPANQPSFWATRAVLLPSGSGIVGYRVQQVNPPGPAQSGALFMPGVAGQLADIPQMCLLCKSPGLGVGNIRRWYLRAVPDVQVVEGEYQPGGSFGAGVPLLFQSLNGLSFAARDLSQTSFPIVSIDATGVITTQAPVTFAVNDMVRVLRTLDSGRNLRGGKFQVTSVGPGNVCQIKNWTYGATTGGKVRKDALVYPNVDAPNTAFSRIITRRIGRPSVGYRGRRSKRRG